MDCPVVILLAALIGTACTIQIDQGPQKRSPEPNPEPKALPEPLPYPKIEYQDVIMYLTPNQISQLGQTQNKHGMILQPAGAELPQEQNQSEATKQENKYVEKQPLRQISKDLEQYLKLQDSAVFRQQLLNEKVRQLKQKQQNQQDAVLKQQQLKEQEQQYLKQQNSRELEQQLLKEQSRRYQQYFNQQDTKQSGKQLPKTQSQTLAQQRLKINQLEQQLLSQRSKELEELFIKEQEARELIDQLQKQPKSAPREFSPYWYLQQLQNSTEQKNKESSQKLEQKYVAPQSLNRSLKTLAPEISVAPQQEPEAEQLKPVVEEEPQLQYVYMDANGESVSIPLDVLKQQLILKSQPQERLGEQKPTDLKQERNVQDKLRFVPYPYTPEQQELYLQLGKNILEKQLSFQEQAKKELETGLKLSKENIEIQKLGKHIYEPQILLSNPVIHQFDFTRKLLKLKKPSKSEIINQEEAEIVDVTKPTNLYPVDKLPKDAAKLQELANLDFLQKLRELENENKDYFTHLDLLNQQNKLAKLQTTIRNKERKLTSEELEQEIKNIQQEIQKAKASAKTTTKSKPHDVEKDSKTMKPYIVKVPVELINRYAVNTK